jgi:hypothetical protein
MKNLRTGAMAAFVGIDRRLTPRVSVVLAGLIGFSISVLRAPSPQFLYDAYSYWFGAYSIVRLDNFFEAGGLALRGAMSSVVYVPAATVDRIFGPETAAHAVLIQNSILIALLGAVLVPGLAGLFLPVSRRLVLLSGGITALILGGFAAHPLMDIWAAALVLAGILFAARSRAWWSLAAAGASLGFAINLRPAYLIPALVVALVWVVVHRYGSLWIVLGALLSAVPQLIVNLYFARRLIPWPIDSFRVVEVQSRYAAFVIRFDGIAYHDVSHPQLFYCDPTMAGRIADHIPNGSGELLSAFLGNLPDSLLLMAQKVAASLIWSADTPYSDLPSAALPPLAILITALSALGVVGLIWSTVGHNGPMRLATSGPLLALWLGCVATLAYSTTEARFAIPVVFIGLVGCVVAASRFLSGTRISRSTLIWLGSAVVLAGLLLWIGSVGLSHPAPPGDVTPALCVRGR